MGVWNSEREEGNSKANTIGVCDRWESIYMLRIFICSSSDQIKKYISLK